MLHQIATQSQTSKINYNREMANSALPFMTFEDDREYSIVLNILGYNPKDIFIDANKSSHELGVYVGKQGAFARSVSFLVFEIPADGEVDRVAMKFKGGGLEITVPKIQGAYVYRGETKCPVFEGIVA